MVLLGTFEPSDESEVEDLVSLVDHLKEEYVVVQDWPNAEVRIEKRENMTLTESTQEEVDDVV